MVKQEQMRDRKKLAAQNRDLQVHLKELLPASMDYSAEFTETASPDPNIQVNKLKTANVTPRTPIEHSNMKKNIQLPGNNKYFGNRKKTMDHPVKF